MVKRRKPSAVLNTSISILVIVVALWFLFRGEAPRQISSREQGAIVKTEADRSTNSASPPSLTTETSLKPETKPSDELPAGFPADRVVRTQPPADTELPADLQRQLDAQPPELPEDLKAQLNAPPPEMPEDLKAQLNAAPPEIPEDIKRAMQTPPRIVTIDEVNDPNFLEKQGK